MNAIAEPAQSNAAARRAARRDVPISGAALFLDFDGTLAPIAPTPVGVVPDAAVNDLLRRAAAALGGRLALLSGREISEIDRLTEGGAAFVAGGHGLERRAGGGALTRTAPHPALADAVTALAQFADAREGLLLEVKRSSVALHYRLAPHLADAATARAGGVAEATGLDLQLGDMVVELKTPGPDKGAALADFMAEPPFAGAAPIHIGDDHTDEAAFIAATRLGGFGVIVGERAPTAALCRLKSPAAVIAWIERSITGGAFRTEDMPWAG